MLSNTANTPIEGLEMDHDFLRIKRYEMVQDSGGAGEHRGGLGVRRVYEVIKDGVLLSTNGDRIMTGPWALVGGQEGSRAMFGIMRNGALMKLPAATNIAVESGDEIIIEISGGGGYGNPKQRDRAAVRQDLKEGRISEAAASTVYGFIDAKEQALIGFEERVT
jgi:N-methylhydantoinase B